MRTTNLLEKIMDSPYQVYLALRASLVVISTDGSDAAARTCSGFHIGSGYFVTSKHAITASPMMSVRPAADFGVMTSIEVEEVLLSRDPNVDLAVLRTRISLSDAYLNGNGEVSGRTLDDFCAIRFGGEYPEGQHPYVLEEVVVLGTATAPRTSGPDLTGIRAQINMTSKHQGEFDYCFQTISAVARAGLEGSAVVDRYGELVGVVCRSENGDGTKPGLVSAISVAALMGLLHENHVHLPNNPNPFYVEEEVAYGNWFTS